MFESENQAYLTEQEHDRQKHETALQAVVSENKNNSKVGTVLVFQL
jgi:hypothetical protein